MIVNIATFFALLDSPLYFCQLLTIGPKSLWFSIQIVNLVEHFEKDQAAIRTNTVVGNPGIMIPI